MYVRCLIGHTIHGYSYILNTLYIHICVCILHVDDGCTPLHEAVANGNVVVLRWLIDHGANPSVQLHHGGTCEVVCSFSGVCSE